MLGMRINIMNNNKGIKVDIGHTCFPILAGCRASTDFKHKRNFERGYMRRRSVFLIKK